MELVETAGVRENFYEGGEGLIGRLGCVDDAVGQCVFDQICRRLQLELV
jgi:hypothetical protein